ncbi:MAG: CvpA family protein [Clostridia bacterium]|nr:CvpA family protein [Clostridia bacterium]
MSVIELNENKVKKGWWITLLNWVIYFVILGAVYWFTLPPVHWQSKEFWNFIIFALLLRLAMSGFEALRKLFSEKPTKESAKEAFKGFGFVSKFTGITAALIILFLLVGGVIGAELFNASRYSDLLTMNDGDFSADVSELPMSSIPVVDLDTAKRLGLRKLGEMSDLVSQFEVDEYYYTQINYKGNPYRVTPLMYGDAFKWLNNQSDGIPAYITVNMVTQETSLVRLQQGIRFSDTEYFMRDLRRHLRFQYPTKIFDNISFELDENGTPYWVASTVRYRVGVFGGRDINGAVLCNAINGECTYYPLNEVPTWVDQVYSSDLLLQQLIYNGKYQSGYFNSIFGQKGVLQPTDGHNYIAIDDDVYLYTGITSVAGDESNVGFVLVNLRTKETSYYVCPGAEEYSAMESAQGVVQDLGYAATFPLLLNVSDRPTYFMSLKDSAGLVKMYAYVDVQQYHVVATGNTIPAAREAYVEKLKAEANIEIQDSAPEQSVEQKTITATIRAISSAVVNGETCYYMMLQNDPSVYVAKVSVSYKLPFAKAGDAVALKVPAEAVAEQVTVIGFDPQ